MPNINRYQVRIFGSPNGIGHKRAEICMFTDEPTKDPNLIAGTINFYDAASFPADSQAGDGKIQMHLPSALLGSVVDLLRNEKPFSFGFHDGHARLHSAHELVGEGE